MSIFVCRQRKSPNNHVLDLGHGSKDIQALIMVFAVAGEEAYTWPRFVADVVFPYLELGYQYLISSVAGSEK